MAVRLGAGRVFKDVDTIEPGDDFAEVITGAVQACAVLLAVIGGRWLTAAGPDGRRLDDPDDFVRLEIEAALARGVRVIPVLVDGTTMPRPVQLPASLAPLARRQAIELSHSRFSADLTGLLKLLDRELRAVPAQEPLSDWALPARVRPAVKAHRRQRKTVFVLSRDRSPASGMTTTDSDAGARTTPMASSSTPSGTRDPAT
jgi:hypothetical protein